jgi:hypothetical protein
MADEYGGPDGLDLRNVMVVTPAARAGRRLVELLLEEAEARGIPLTPPTTVTMGRFPELLYQPTGPLADSTTSRHAFAQALKATDPDFLNEVFPEISPGLSGWMALAGIVEKLHREVGGEGLDFRHVSREFKRGLPYDDSARWDVLAEVQTTYLEVLKGSGLRDRDRERRAALEEGRLTSPGDVWMVGVVELPGVVRRMLEALPGPVRALIHAPQEVRSRFDSMGCYVSDEWRGIHIPLGDDQVQVVRRPRDQAAATAAVLRGLGGRYAAEEVVVGVPDPELVPFVERELSGVDVPHRFAGGTRLEETGPIRLLQALAEYLDGRPFPAFAALIRHPDLHEMVEAAVTGASGSQWTDEVVDVGPPLSGSPGGSTGAEEPTEAREVTGALTVVDRFQSQHLQDSVKGPLPGEDKDARRTRTLVKNLDRDLGLEAFTETRPISAWMPDILEVLVKVYGGQPLDRGKRGVRQMVDAVTRIKGAATRLATLPRKLDVKVEAPEAVSILLAELTGPEMTIPPDPEEHAVELLGWLELPLDDAPAVILTGVNERILPEAVGADPFLPGTLRTHLGIPDDGARYARDAYLLSALIHSAEEVHLLAGRTTIQGDPLRPSRLLFADEPEVVAQRIRRYLGDRDGDEVRVEVGDEVGAPAHPDMASPTGADTIVREPVPERRSLFHSPPQNPLPALASLPRIRVTDFATYLHDPYRYALTRVMKLEPLDDGAREMDGGVFGSLAHHVLERLGRSEEVGAADPNVLQKKLSQLLDHAVRDKFGSRPVPAVRVQVEQLRARLRRFAQWQADWIQDGWRVVAVEQQPEPGVPFEVDGEAVLLRGKIDRIDHKASTGEWAIFDYKTGDQGKRPDETHRKGRGAHREWVDLQLPLYRSLLPGVTEEDGTPLVPESAWKHVTLGYILLPRELSQVGAAFAKWTEDDLAEAYETAKRVVRRLRSQPFHYDPNTRSFRDDPLDALLGRLELPRAADGDGDAGGRT